MITKAEYETFEKWVENNGFTHEVSEYMTIWVVDAEELRAQLRKLKENL